MSSRTFVWQRRGSVVVLAAVMALTLGVSACSNQAGKSDADSANDSAGAATASSAAGNNANSSRSEDAAEGAKVEDALVSNLKADAEQLMASTEQFLAKDSVSETSQNMARDLKPILQAQLTALEDVPEGESLVNQDEAARVADSSGAAADIAYLTMLEENVGRLADAWQGLKSSSNPTYAEVANKTAEQLAQMKARVDKRMQF